MKPFKKVDAARPDSLSVDEAQRLFNAADPDFSLVIQALLHSGCRYGEITRLKVGDFEHECIVVRKSKSDKMRDVELSEEAVAFFTQLCVGRRKDATMLLRNDEEGWGPNHQARRMAETCKRAGIEPAIGVHGLRHGYASLSIMAGVPVLSVARNLGHADTRMCERHYGHLTEQYQRDVIRAGAPTFGIIAESNVVPLPVKGAK